MTGEQREKRNERIRVEYARLKNQGWQIMRIYAELEDRYNLSQRMLIYVLRG